MAGTQQLSVCCCCYYYTKKQTCSLKIKKSENFKKELIVIAGKDWKEKRPLIKDLSSFKVKRALRHTMLHPV